jgi:hypothetical protein
MTVSVRSYLTAGAAAMVVSAAVLAPVQPSAPTWITADTVRLSAAAQPLVNEVNTAAAALSQVGTVVTPAQPRAQAAVQANNSASNAIDAVYGWILYWGSYLALDLGPYLLGWVPFGYLISDQIYIWYPNFTVPVADSFVYDFLDPVVNDFWNPTVWRNGLTSIVQTAVSSLGTVANQEIAYFLSLGWFPIPLPPLPPLPFAATKVPAAAAGTSTAADEKSAPAGSTVAPATGHSARPQTAKQSPDSLVAAAATDTTDTTGTTTGATKTATAAKTVKGDGTDAASGKSSAASTGGDTGKKSTAGSARSHGPKTNKAGGE